MDRFESEVADLGHSENEAVGLETGVDHLETEVDRLDIGVGIPAGQEAGIAGVERRVDYWDTGAYLEGQSLSVAAGMESVVVAVGTETVVVAVGKATAEDLGAGHMAGDVMRTQSCPGDQKRAFAAAGSSETQLQPNNSVR